MDWVAKTEYHKDHIRKSIEATKELEKKVRTS